MAEENTLHPLPVQEDEEIEEVDEAGELVQMARWPQMTTLMEKHEEVVLKLLRACDECDVLTELTASDTGNVKGNKWVRLQDNVFGGRDDGIAVHEKAKAEYKEGNRKAKEAAKVLQKEVSTSSCKHPVHLVRIVDNVGCKQAEKYPHHEAHVAANSVY